MKPLLLWLCLFYPLLALPKKPVTNLNPKTKASYLKLLDQAVDFHKALDKGDPKNIKQEIQKTQEMLTQVYQNSLSLPAFQHRIHSYKLLSNIEEQLTGLKPADSGFSPADKKNVKKLFLAFFELAQVYDLNKEMKGRMFYCPKDRSIWIQSSNKARNPINPEYLSCGTIIL